MAGRMRMLMPAYPAPSQLYVSDMSLHRYVVPPPVAVAVEPAPPPRPRDRRDEKDPHDKDKKDPKLEPKDKPDDRKKDNEGAAGKKEDKDKGKDAQNADHKADVDPKPTAKVVTPDTVLPQTPTPPDESPVTPTTGASMIPEPPTPAPGAHNDLPDTPVPGPKPARGDKPRLDDKAEPAGKDRDTRDSKMKDDAEEDGPEPSPPPQPLRMLGPAPPRPVTTRLQLNSAKPYPPINTDPRGAYFKYARGVQAEWILIDVTKDGWLVEQWKEKSERDALARLTGEADKQRDREVAALERRNKVRKVPKRSEDILLHLWNDLAEAANYELPADEFWARYDWASPEAALHLEDVKDSKREEDNADASKEEKAGDERDRDSPDSDIEADEKKGKAVTQGMAGKEENGKTEVVERSEPKPPVMWCCTGIEEILATVGVQCSYKTEGPPPRHWAEPPGGYLIMAHGFFMLRTENMLRWKTEEAANQFELLKTSHHDRVFGEMVKAQQMEERKKKEAAYRQRKMEERKKAEEEAKKAKAEGREVHEGKDAKDKQGKEERDHKDLPKMDRADAKGLEVDVPEPVTPISNAKVHDGREIKPEKPSGTKEIGKGAVANENGDVVVAVPLTKEGDAAQDEKHEEEAVAVPPQPKDKVAEPGKDDKKGVQEKDEKKDIDEKEKGKGKEQRDEKKDDPKGKAKDDAKKVDPKKGDPKHHHHSKPPPKMSAQEAKLLAEMLQATGGVPDSLAMEDIHMAFKAIEKATENSKAEEKNKGPNKPLIWTWAEPCEKWRWKNHEAGLQDVAVGGWEERDWKVFADGRGCNDFEREEEWAEEDEEDIHDWSC